MDVPAASTFNSLISESHKALESWKTFDYLERKPGLDNACTDMRENKTASIQGRKRLNELTKTFRAQSVDEQVNGITELLKAYQEEIDQLSRRSKYVEAIFHKLYKDLYTEPIYDPVPYFENLIHVVTSSSTTSLEIEKLKSEIAQYDEEFQNIRNQDVTIRRLEEQLLEYQESVEEKVMEQVNIRSMESQQIYKDEVLEAQQQTLQAERRLDAALASMKDAQLQCDKAQSQLFEVNASNEKRVSALLAENSMLLEEAERGRGRMAEIENDLSRAIRAKNELLVSSNEGTTLSTPSTAVGEETESLRRENAAMKESLSELNTHIRSLEDSTAASIRDKDHALNDMQSLLTKERSLTSDLRQSLNGRPTREAYRSLKRQLQVMQKVAFNVDDEDGTDATDEDTEDENDADGKNNGTSSNRRDKIKIDEMLLSRVKILESELAENRSKIAVSTSMHQDTQREMDKLKLTISKQDDLIRQLEGEIEVSQVLTDTTNTDPNLTINTNASMMDKELGDLLGVNTKQIPGSHIKSNNTSGKTRVVENANKNQLIQNLQLQRDRYKGRIEELDNDVNGYLQQIQLLMESKQSLENDNKQLYSKLRYLQSNGYNSSTGTVTRHEDHAHRMEYGVSPQAMRIRQHTKDDDDNDIEAHYQQLYEAQLNPFNLFEDMEKQAKVQELTVSDRVLYTSLSSLLSDKRGRFGLLIYVGVMHLFVFICIYWLTHNTHHGCDPRIDHEIKSFKAGQANGLS